MKDSVKTDKVKDKYLKHKLEDLDMPVGFRGKPFNEYSRGELVVIIAILNDKIEDLKGIKTWRKIIKGD